MKASLQSARIAPKKANLIAMLVRGLTVPDAVEALRRTNKKGARLVEKLLLSAMANASHNSKQDPQTMVIKSIVVNQGTAYRRGMPKARGQTRPFRKFLSHIDVILGFAEDGKDMSAHTRRNEKGMKVKKEVSAKNPSQKAKNTVKTSGNSKTKDTKKSSASESSVSS